MSTTTKAANDLLRLIAAAARIDREIYRNKINNQKIADFWNRNGVGIRIKAIAYLMLIFGECYLFSMVSYTFLSEDLVANPVMRNLLSAIVTLISVIVMTALLEKITELGFYNTLTAEYQRANGQPEIIRTTLDKSATNWTNTKAIVLLVFAYLILGAAGIYRMEVIIADGYGSNDGSTTLQKILVTLGSILVTTLVLFFHDSLILWFRCRRDLRKQANALKLRDKLIHEAINLGDQNLQPLLAINTPSSGNTFIPRISPTVHDPIINQAIGLYEAYQTDRIDLTFLRPVQPFKLSFNYQGTKPARPLNVLITTQEGKTYPFLTDHSGNLEGKVRSYDRQVLTFNVEGLTYDNFTLPPNGLAIDVFALILNEEKSKNLADNTATPQENHEPTSLEDIIVPTIDTPPAEDQENDLIAHNSEQPDNANYNGSNNHSAS